MRIALAQMEVTPYHCEVNFQRIEQYVGLAKQQGAQVVVFPEMALSGYFIGDHYEEESFLKQCELYHTKILNLSEGIDIIFGSLGIDWQKINEDGRVRKYNAVYHASKRIFNTNPKTGYPFLIKTLLPNYSQFSDARHFYSLRQLAQDLSCSVQELYQPFEIFLQNCPNSRASIFSAKKEKIVVGISICEDAWNTSYSDAPVDMISKHWNVDFLLNLSASPFAIGKYEVRKSLMEGHGKKQSSAALYLNQVGSQNVGKTIYGFDGRSFLVNQNGETINLGGFFEETLCVLDFDPMKKDWNIVSKIPTFIHKEIEQIRIALEFLIKKCCSRWGIKRILIGVSGGIDSALSAVLCAQALGPQNVFLVNMPSQFNADITKNAAQTLAQNLGCPYAIIPIQESVDFTMSQLKQTIFYPSSINAPMTTLVCENIQARDRGSRILAGLAASLGAVFSCNSNKTELSVGYGTLYGDLCGFLCPIGDLWKGDVYALASHYNESVFQKTMIPKDIFDVVPSAELSEAQDVTRGQGDPLIYPYHDKLFASWLEHWNRKTLDDCVDAYEKGTLDKLLGLEVGFAKSLFPDKGCFLQDAKRWWGLFQGLGALKRVQAPPILAVSRRAYGFDYRECI